MQLALRTWLGNHPCRPGYFGFYEAIVSALRAVISQSAGAGEQQPLGLARVHIHSLACLLKLFKMLLKASLSAGRSDHLASLQAMLTSKVEIAPKRSASLLWSLVNMLTGDCKRMQLCLDRLRHPQACCADADGCHFANCRSPAS